MRLVILLLLCPAYLFAQSGPGGPGTNDGTSNLVLWLKADSGTNITSTAINGIKLNEWQDHSGYDIYGLAPENFQRPTYQFNAVNECYPSIYFDGKDDYFQLFDEDDDDDETIDPFSVKDDFVIYFVAKADVIHDVDTQSNQPGDYDGIDYQRYILGPHFEQGNNAGLGVSLGTNGVSAYEYGQNYFPAVNTVTNNPPDFYIGNEYHIYALTVKDKVSTFCIDGQFMGTGLPSNRNHVRIPTEIGGAMSSALSTMDNFFEGNLTELIIFKDSVNMMEHLSIQNYLSAKYNIELTVGDVYTMDDPENGNYDHHVAGIGKLGNEEILLESKGSGIVCISGATNLDENEFIFWGNSTKDDITELATEIPVGAGAMLNAAWAVSEIGETGKLSVCLNYGIFGDINPKHLRLLIDTNGDGSFLDEEIVEQFQGEIVELNSETSEITFNEQDLNDGDIFTFASRSTLAPLPITLSSFTAKVVNEQQVLLNWTTESETNNSHFVVERSTDNRTFHPIGMVNGNGTTQTIQLYNLTDRQPFHGENYYRLKQVDLDGKYSYSNIVRADIRIDETDIFIYPNPVLDDMIVNLPKAVKGMVTLRIYGATGQLVQDQTIDQENYTNINITTDLNPGVYFLRVRSKNYEQCKSFVITSTN